MKMATTTTMRTSRCSDENIEENAATPPSSPSKQGLVNRSIPAHISHLDHRNESKMSAPNLAEDEYLAGSVGFDKYRKDSRRSSIASDSDRHHYHPNLVQRVQLGMGL